ncbi:MAG TPA: enoyl-CoA hydratase [Verrucomicrobiales bacterium]|nr:enoyl-CoA hydratase [Verrucomicrobiales bacterium]
MKEVLYETTDAVATITLNRPDKLNALTEVMENELCEAMSIADRDEAVRCIILTGAGRGFCAGADISRLNSLSGKNLKEVDPEEIKQQIVPPRPKEGVREDFQRCWSYFPAISKPIIAAINGPTVGLGFILTLYCDVRIASDQARFSTAFAKRGLIAEHGIAWMLPRLIGISNTLDLLYSARTISAEDALRMNLVSQVVPQDLLMEKTVDYARMLSTQVSPRSLKEMKREVYNGLFQSLNEAIDDADDDMVRSFASDDFKEGVAHFIEKRPPRFTGR